MDIGVLLVALFDFSVLLVSFFSLCIICDEHLVPAVEVFIVQFEVPEEVAAVTLVAFGSAAPELFLNSVSAVAQTSDLSMAAILGSGIIAFGLIPPLCILSAPHTEIKLKLFPIIRECTFYLTGLFVFLASIKDGRLASFEAGCLILVYLCYTGVVAIMYFRGKAAAEQDRANANSTELVALSAISPNTSRTAAATRASSPMNRSIQDSRSSSPTSFSGTGSPIRRAISPQSAPSRLAVSEEEAHYFDDSPRGQSDDCKFFPRLSRSMSADLTLRRGTSKGSLQPGQGSNGNSPRTIPPNMEDPESVPLMLDDVEAVGPAFDATEDAVGANGGGNTQHESAWHSVVMRTFRAIYIPIEHVIRSFMPALHPNIPHFITGNNTTLSANRNPVVGTSQVPLRRAILVLVCCIASIGVLAVTIVLFCESIIKQLGFSTTAMGATLVALGAEIPDTVSAVALARNGYYNAAMAGAIGSQVINVSLGVGVPALLVCLTGDGYLRIAQPETAGLVLLTFLLIMLILSYVTVTVPVFKLVWSQRWGSNTVVSKPGAAFQLAVWVLTYVAFLHFSKTEPGIPVPV